MKISMQTFVLTVISGIFLAACSTKVPVEGLYQSNNFTYPSIHHEHIGVGGVTSSVTNTSPATANTYAASIRNSVIHKYPGLDIMPAGQMASALGRTHYNQMMQAYTSNGVIDEKYLSEMKQHIRGMRYVIFGRIVQDSVGNHRNTYSDRIDFSTNRTMRVEYKIYDLNDKQIAWSGTVRQSAHADNSYPLPKMPNNNDDPNKPHDSRDDLVRQSLNLAATAFIQGNHDYPVAPSAYGVFRKTSNGFASRLPVKPKGNHKRS